jgi:hypothetical protein
MAAAAAARPAALRRAPPTAPRPAGALDPVAGGFLIDGERLPPEAAAALAEALREPDLPRDGAARAPGGPVGLGLILLSACATLAAIGALS